MAGRVKEGCNETNGWAGRHWGEGASRQGDAEKGVHLNRRMLCDQCGSSPSLMTLPHPSTVQPYPLYYSPNPLPYVPSIRQPHPISYSLTPLYYRTTEDGLFTEYSVLIAIITDDGSDEVKDETTPMLEEISASIPGLTGDGVYVDCEYMLLPLISMCEAMV